MVPGPMTGAGSDEKLPTTSTEKTRIHSTLLYGGSSGTSAWHTGGGRGGLLLKSSRAAIPLARIARRDLSPFLFS